MANKNNKLKALLEKFADDLEDFRNQPGYECYNVSGAIDQLRDELYDMDMEDEDQSLDAEVDDE